MLLHYLTLNNHTMAHEPRSSLCEWNLVVCPVAREYQLLSARIPMIGSRIDDRRSDSMIMISSYLYEEKRNKIQKISK